MKAFAAFTCGLIVTVAWSHLCSANTLQVIYHMGDVESWLIAHLVYVSKTHSWRCVLFNPASPSCRSVLHLWRSRACLYRSWRIDSSRTSQQVCSTLGGLYLGMTSLSYFLKSYLLDLVAAIQTFCFRSQPFLTLHPGSGWSKSIGRVASCGFLPHYGDMGLL